MGKETARRAANRLGRIAKKSGSSKPVKKTIAKAPREIRDARDSAAPDDHMDGMGDDETGHKQASGKKKASGRNRRKKQRSLSQDKRAAKRRKESRKHIN
tara:strand:+ start:600 stop:899 length:300 start_codon:yes stop_codon:yes gene_type:complete